MLEYGPTSCNEFEKLSIIGLVSTESVTPSRNMLATLRRARTVAICFTLSCCHSQTLISLFLALLQITAAVLGKFLHRWLQRYLMWWWHVGRDAGFTVPPRHAVHFLRIMRDDEVLLHYMCRFRQKQWEHGLVNLQKFAHTHSGIQATAYNGTR